MNEPSTSHHGSLQMTSMRAAILRNPTLAETIRQNDAAREAERRTFETNQRAAYQRRQATAIRYRRDVAIAALVKARRHKKKSAPHLTQVLACVATLRGVLQPA